MNEDTLRALALAYGPTGREARVAELIMRSLEGSGLGINKDALGNVTALKGEPPYRIFVTHIDQPSWAVEHRSKEGMLSLKPVPRESKLGEGWAVDDKSELYRVSREEEGKSWRAEPLVETQGDLGTFLVPYGEFRASGKLLFGPALSDRTGAAILVELAGEVRESDNSFAFVFYVGRHLNFMGLRASLEGLEAERVFVVEGVASKKEETGPLVFLRTQRSIAPYGWVEEIARLAQEAQIKLEKTMVSDTASPADSLASAGIASVVLGVGVAYRGSQIERVRDSDYEELKRLLKSLILERSRT